MEVSDILSQLNTTLSNLGLLPIVFSGAIITMIAMLIARVKR